MLQRYFLIYTRLTWVIFRKHNLLIYNIMVMVTREFVVIKYIYIYKSNFYTFLRDKKCCVVQKVPDNVTDSKVLEFLQFIPLTS